MRTLTIDGNLNQELPDDASVTKEVDAIFIKNSTDPSLVLLGIYSNLKILHFTDCEYICGSSLYLPDGLEELCIDNCNLDWTDLYNIGYNGSLNLRTLEITNNPTLHGRFDMEKFTQLKSLRLSNTNINRMKCWWKVYQLNGLDIFDTPLIKNQPYIWTWFKFTRKIKKLFV